jgi:hypothetical protein
MSTRLTNPYEIATAINHKLGLGFHWRVIYDARVKDYRLEFQCVDCDKWHPVKNIRIGREELPPTQ